MQKKNNKNGEAFSLHEILVTGSQKLHWNSNAMANWVQFALKCINEKLKSVQM